MYIDARRSASSLVASSAVSVYVSPARYVIVRLLPHSGQTQHQLESIRFVCYRGVEPLPAGSEFSHAAEAALTHLTHVSIMQSPMVKVTTHAHMRDFSSRHRVMSSLRACACVHRLFDFHFLLSLSTSLWKSRSNLYLHISQAFLVSRIEPALRTILCRRTPRSLWVRRIIRAIIALWVAAGARCIVWHDFPFYTPTHIYKHLRTHTHLSPPCSLWVRHNFVLLLTRSHLQTYTHIHPLCVSIPFYCQTKQKRSSSLHLSREK